MSYQIFIPNKLDLTFRASNHCSQFHQDRVKIAAVWVFTDRLTKWQNDRQTQVILYSVSCYVIAMRQIKICNSFKPNRTDI